MQILKNTKNRPTLHTHAYVIKQLKIQKFIGKFELFVCLMPNFKKIAKIIVFKIKQNTNISLIINKFMIFINFFIKLKKKKKTYKKSQTEIGISQPCK